jgi:cytochrome P450
MAELGNVRRAVRLWRSRIGLRRHAVAGDLLCQLLLHDHLQNPYPVYDRIRARGSLYHSRAGIYAITSHALCAGVLKDPSFMRRNEGDPARLW